MALWWIAQHGDKITLRYRESMFSDEETQRCGEGNASLQPALEEWVVEQTGPWDLILTPRGLFAFLAQPNTDFCQ